MERRIRVGTLTVNPNTSIASAPVKRSLAAIVKRSSWRIDVVPHVKNSQNGTPSQMDVQLIQMRRVRRPGRIRSSKPYPVIFDVATVTATSQQEAMREGVEIMNKRNERNVDKVGTV